MRVGTWGGADEARQIVIEAIERYNTEGKGAQA